jgi:hypothetical protein
LGTHKPLPSRIAAGWVVKRWVPIVGGRIVWGRGGFARVRQLHHDALDAVKGGLLTA